MVEKTKTNEHGDVIFTEDDAIDLLYTNPDFDISKLFFEDTAKYDAALKELGLDLPTIRNTPERGPLQDEKQQHRLGRGQGVQRGQFLPIPDRRTQDQSLVVQSRHHRIPPMISNQYRSILLW
jgi:hypothetical protein